MTKAKEKLDKIKKVAAYVHVPISSGTGHCRTRKEKRINEV